MRFQSKWLLLVFLAGGLIGAFFGRITAVSDHPRHLEKLANQAEKDSPPFPRPFAGHWHDREVAVSAFQIREAFGEGRDGDSPQPSGHW